MSDYTKLIEQLRSGEVSYYDGRSADAIEALQKEVSTLDVLLEECKMDWSGDVTQLKAEHKREIEALQAENERLTQDRDEWRDSTIAANANAASEEKRRREMQDQRDQLKSRLDDMGKGEPVAHVYAIERTGRPLVAWDDARGIGLGDKLYATPEALTEVINKARIFGLGLPIVQTERLIKAIESLKEPTP